MTKGRFTGRIFRKMKMDRRGKSYCFLQRRLKITLLSELLDDRKSGLHGFPVPRILSRFYFYV